MFMKSLRASLLLGMETPMMQISGYPPISLKKDLTLLNAMSMRL